MPHVGFVGTGRDSGESCQQRRCQVVCPDYQGCESSLDHLIQAIVPSADEVVTQGDVHEEIDLLCYLNVEGLEISMLLASTREHPRMFGGVTGIIADALERRHDVIVCSSPMGRMSKACIDVVPCILTTHKVPVHPHGTFATGASRIVGGARETDGRKLARTERKQTQKLVFAGEGEASWRYRGL